MKFSAWEEMEVAIADAWRVVVDFDQFERIAREKGAAVKREEGRTYPAWNASFRFKGRPREVRVTVDRMEAPSLIACSGVGKSVEGTVLVELVSLSQRRTRIVVTSEVRPRSFAARLFLQSVKLARGRVVKRYQSRVTQAARMIEARAVAAGT